jgi:urea carboxylase
VTGWAFDTVLIANRGEIAGRIIRTAKRLGLRTVAVYSDADAGSPHVRQADQAVNIGPAPARGSYLNADAILAAAKESGATAIHPGYGFLSENAGFARQAEAADITFVGPAPDQLEAFGVKHTARDLARQAGVPLTAGTNILQTAEEAVAQANAIGFPVMVKATGGGGGIGMLACRCDKEVADAFDQVERVARASFGTGGVFLERLVRPARHVEVQVFGDGTGDVAVLGDRDCSLQRRNQKVVEEAPAPGLPDDVRRRLHESARDLAASVRYRSAGTVEFIYDPVRREASFLEVNARLQVEHPVTEAVFGVDLVEQMLRLAGQGPAGVADFMRGRHVPHGHAIEARVYAEDPNHDGRPSAGLITSVRWPEHARVETWVEAGTEVTAHYDPMLAKIITHSAERPEPSVPGAAAAAGDAGGGSARRLALREMADALTRTAIDGVTTNLGLLRAVLAREDVAQVAHSTSTLADVTDPEPRIEVLSPGTLTTIQDWPGRIGYWQVGVPPSGPMDEVSLRAVNVAVGNAEGAPALECTATGPSLTFSASTVVCLGGAVAEARLIRAAPGPEAPDPQTAADGEPVPWWTPFQVPAGVTLDIGPIPGPGLRTYLAVQGGFDVPEYLGSASTFTLGRFGGHSGRALQPGDVLYCRGGSDPPQTPPALGGAARPPEPPAGSPFGTPGPVPLERRPAIVSEWEIGVTEGPHAAPEFFTRADIETLYASTYTVHHNSARTGVRLIGPSPEWAREDGGEAGLHPSNIHDTAYAVGALDFTGDTPIILGPDGPSLGGFVCPAVVASGELWKTGQLRPGDTLRFVPVREADAAALRDKCASVSVPRSGGASAGGASADGDGDDGILARREGGDGAPDVVYRRDGDDNMLVEYGQPVLDIGLRMRVHALQTALEAEGVTGVIDYTPGIRSLQIHTDAAKRRASSLVPLLQRVEDELPPTHQLRVPSRTVRLPLSWDDPATRLAIERYMAGVRSDAPWTPWNIEFIRRINGLSSVQEVRRIVFGAKYLVLGLGDVYLGAPVATPLDPRHRLVTTKYNPARTWTAENSVGIGGAYLCIYGMEGPGGYQFVGRTIQVWNRFRRSGLFAGQPWALRFFDQIEWYPVSTEELLDLRAQTAAGRGPVDITDGEFDYGAYTRFLADNSGPIADFRATQAAAFTGEKERWRASGEFDRDPDPAGTTTAGSGGGPGTGPDGSGPETVTVPEGAATVTAPLPASVWQVEARPGLTVAKGDTLLSLEAMKMETIVTAPRDGTVAGVYATPGAQVSAGQVLVIIK